MCDETNLQNEVYEFIVTGGFEDDMDATRRSSSDPVDLLMNVIKEKPQLSIELINNLAMTVINLGFYNQTKLLLKIAVQYYKLLDNKVKLALLYSHKLNKWIPELFDEIYIDCMDMKEFDWQYTAHMFFFYNKMDEVKWILDNTSVKGTLVNQRDNKVLVIPDSGYVSYAWNVKGNYAPKIIRMPLLECEVCQSKDNIVWRNNLRWPILYCRLHAKGFTTIPRCKFCTEPSKELLGSSFDIFCSVCLIKVLTVFKRFGCFCGCDEDIPIRKNLRQDIYSQHVYGHYSTSASLIKSLMAF